MYTLIGPIVIDRTNTIPNFVIEQIQYLICLEALEEQHRGTMHCMRQLL
jgi:hypothetical protein